MSQARTTEPLNLLVRYLAEDDRVRARCREPLSEYSYASLSTMLLDAIFSIGIHYDQVKRVVARHAEGKYDLRQFGDADPYPLPALINEGRESTFDEFAAKLGNRCRTSSRWGILKAEAVILVAEVLVHHGIVDLPTWSAADVETMKAAESSFRAVRGQGSGLSWRYLSMLAGRDDEVKPDRMIVRYVALAVGRATVPPDEAGALLIAAAAALRGKSGYPDALSARQLDSAVWKTARQPRRRPSTLRFAACHRLNLPE